MRSSIYRTAQNGFNDKSSVLAVSGRNGNVMDEAAVFVFYREAV